MENVTTSEFVLWKNQVNEELVQVCGLVSDDMPDADYYGMFEDGLSPREAAHQVIAEEGFYDGDE